MYVWTHVEKTDSAGPDKSVHAEIYDEKPVVSTDNKSAPLP